MKEITGKAFTGILTIFLLGGLCTALFAEDLQSVMDKMSETQQVQMEKKKKNYEQERATCMEHCGGSVDCMNKCKRAFETRMERAAMEIMHSSSAPAGDIEAYTACSYCGMNRQKFNYSRMYVEYDDGTTLGTCSLRCTAVDMAVHMELSPLKVWVADYDTRRLIDAESAVWVLGGDKAGVMSRRAKWAFETPEAADAFIRENGGEIVSFDDAMSAAYMDMYEDIKMIRQKRKAMHTEHAH